MSVKSDIENKVEDYSPRIERLTQLTLGQIQVIPFSKINVNSIYMQISANEVFTLYQQNNIKTAERLLENYKTTSSPLFIIPFENFMNIYFKPVMNIHKEKFSEEEYSAITSYITCHELGHLIHKKMVGKNIMPCWPKENAENIANYIAKQIIPKEVLNIITSCQIATDEIKEEIKGKSPIEWDLSRPKSNKTIIDYIKEKNKSLFNTPIPKELYNALQEYN